MGKYRVDTIELRKAMLDNGIRTNEALSRASGVGRDTISRTLNSKIRPSFDVMVKIAEALDLSPERAGRIFFAENLRNP